MRMNNGNLINDKLFDDISFIVLYIVCLLDETHFLSRYQLTLYFVKHN